MDVPIATTLTQQLLSWILLAVLLIWMVFFTCLALRSDMEKQVELDTEEIISSLPQPIPITSAHTRLHKVPVAQSPATAILHEASSERLAEQSVH
ncbi:MAG TPA: hypothetical protein VFB12_15535 [Ktedonobacteraceae bacterium]|nr:hypothetical protein [Ktedonobacteraceae bacterium]